MRPYCTLLLMGILAGCASSPKDSNTDFPQGKAGLKPVNHQTVFHIHTAWNDSTGFQGYLEKTASSTTAGGPLYDGSAGIAGVVAQLAIHAAINNSIRDKREEDAQNNANKVIAEYLHIVKRIDHNSFIDKSLPENLRLKIFSEKNTDDLDEKGSDIVVNLDPKYFMAPDEKSLMLLMNMSVYRRANPKEIIYRQSIKSISNTIPRKNPQSTWKEGNPTYLEQTMHRLFAESISILLKDIVTPLTLRQPGQNTYKYSFGEKTRYERAYLIKETCERLYLKNLRGSIVAIPATGCKGDISYHIPALTADSLN